MISIHSTSIGVAGIILALVLIAAALMLGGGVAPSRADLDERDDLRREGARSSKPEVDERDDVGPGEWPGKETASGATADPSGEMAPPSAPDDADASRARYAEYVQIVRSLRCQRRDLASQRERAGRFDSRESFPHFVRGPYLYPLIPYEADRLRPHWEAIRTIQALYRQDVEALARTEDPAVLAEYDRTLPQLPKSRSAPDRPSRLPSDVKIELGRFAVDLKVGVERDPVRVRLLRRLYRSKRAALARETRALSMIEAELATHHKDSQLMPWSSFRLVYSHQDKFIVIRPGEVPEFDRLIESYARHRRIRVK